MTLKNFAYQTFFYSLPPWAFVRNAKYTQNIIALHPISRQYWQRTGQLWFLCATGL